MLAAEVSSLYQTAEYVTLEWNSCVETICQVCSLLEKKLIPCEFELDRLVVWYVIVVYGCLRCSRLFLGFIHNETVNAHLKLLACKDCIDEWIELTWIVPTKLNHQYAAIVIPYFRLGSKTRFRSELITILLCYHIDLFDPLLRVADSFHDSGVNLWVFLVRSFLHLFCKLRLIEQLVESI